MAKKLLWYEKYGAIEYYVYDPDFNKLEIYNREADKLMKINTEDWISPLLKFRLLWTADTLKLFHPNGEPFLSYAEVIDDVKSAKVEIKEVKAENEEVKAENERIKLEAKKAKEKAALLAAKLKELGIDPNSLT